MSHNQKVGIIMGSDSDLSVMQNAAKILDEFKVSYELSIVSAHRTPQRMFEYAESAEKRGLSIVIAGAGGAAHLPGMVAALTTIPVIGVPVQSKAMSGIDSLYSIVQMPPGVPVATVAINGAKNAGLLAIEILALNNPELHKKLIDYKNKQRGAVIEKTQTLEKIGFKKYLEIVNK